MSSGPRSPFRLVLGDRTRDLPREGVMRLGTDEGNDLVLAGSGVDAEHARLECRPDGIRIVDLASRDGTRVNGVFVTAQDLKPGDRVTLGGTTFTFEASGSSEQAAPAVVIEVAPGLEIASERATPASRSTGPKLRAPARAAPRRASPWSPVVTAPKASAPGGAAEAAPVPGRAANGRQRKPSAAGPIVVLGVLVVVVVAVAVLATGDEPDEAVQLLGQARTSMEHDLLEDAERTFRKVVERWPDSRSAAEARSALDNLEADQEREKKALEDLDRLWEYRTRLSRGAMLERFGKIQRKLRPSRAADTFVSYEARLDSYYSKLKHEAFRDAKAESDAAMVREDYPGALLAWREYSRLPVRIPRDEERAQREVDRIHGVAETYFVGELERAQELATRGGLFDKALGILAAVETRLQGTRFAARAKVASRRIRRAKEMDSKERVPEAAGPIARTRDEPNGTLENLEALQEAELLASARRYGEALATYERLADVPKDPKLRRDLLGRRGELQDLSFLMDELRRQIADAPHRFEGIPLGESLQAKAISADGSGLDLELPNGSSRLAWRRIDDDRLLGLLERMKLAANGLVALSRFCFLAGKVERAHALLVDANEAGASQSRIDAVISRARRMDVPEGGFVAYRGRWYTPTERDEAALRDRIADLAKRAASSDPRRAEEALVALRELGEPAREALISALRAKRDALRSRLYEIAAGNAALVPVLVKDLKAAREHALSLIYDTVRYPYNRGSGDPYGPNGAQVQKDVDERVAAVRRIWSDPLGHVAEKWPALKEALEALRVVDDEVATLTKEEPQVPAILAEAREKIGLPAVADGKTHASTLEAIADNAKVEDSVVNAEERDCVRAVNRYRMMMGLRGVRINAELTEASRGHSEEMARLNYFAHESPVPENRTPGMRAKNAGYKGGGTSENIARGATTGQAAHDQWIHSSGHHRNVLGRGHTEVGVGQAQGSWWTQMFGRGSGR